MKKFKIKVNEEVYEVEVEEIGGSPAAAAPVAPPAAPAALYRRQHHRPGTRSSAAAAPAPTAAVGDATVRPDAWHCAGGYGQCG